jgi:ADP-ribosyl-[dinitrogen reductase] hydrolase
MMSVLAQKINSTQTISLQQRAIGAYLGLAIGDALGATTEFMTPSEIKYKHGQHNKICGGGWLNLKAGQVTDDTEMTLALGETIIQNQAVVAEKVAQSFSDWMRTKPVDIGHTVRRGIIQFRNNGTSQVVENEHDAGNGACMRCLPIALFFWNKPLQQMIQASRIQSHVTHHSPVADAGTEAILQMITCAMHDGSKSDMQQIADMLVRQYKIYRYDQRRVENPSGWIVETLQVVFQAFFAMQTFEDVLVDVVNRGGDADTTAAIAGMLAGACYGVDAIPDAWLKVLDKKIKTDCQRQALLLLADSGVDPSICTDY